MHNGYDFHVTVTASVDETVAMKQPLAKAVLFVLRNQSAQFGLP